MKKLVYILLFVCAFSLVSCDELKRETKIYELVVASKKYITPESENKDETFTPEHYWVKKNGADRWTFFSTHIRGFEYEEGFEYEIIVEGKEILFPPADGDSMTYSLKKLISKIEKESEGLPE